MNAYELADWLTEHSFLKDTDIAMMPVINMLRQQADRIAELEKLVHKRFDDGKRLGVIETEDRFNRSLQTKPLSDDDVEEFEWMLKKYFNYKPDEPAPNLNRIIRAIESKVRGQ